MNVSDITKVMDRTFAPARPLRSAFGMLAALAAASVVAACSASTNTVTVDGGSVQGSYSIQFPSTAAAVATETVEVRVFGAAAGGCFTLVQKQQSHQQLPDAIVKAGPVSPCDMQTSGAGALTLPFGKVSVLAVATRKNADFLIGCGDGDVSASNAVVTVPLSLAGTSVSVPTTTCAELTAHCSGGCT